MTLTNCGGEVLTRIKESFEGDYVFDGVFCTIGRAPQHTGNVITHFEVKDSKVARHGDHDLDYDKTIAFLNDMYPNFNKEQIDALYEFTAEESNNIDSIEDLEVFEDEFCGYEAFEVSFLFQNIRGLIARNQGFSAIEMNDEYGTSYLVMANTEYAIIA